MINNYISSRAIKTALEITVSLSIGKEKAGKAIFLSSQIVSHILWNIYIIMQQISF